MFSTRTSKLSLAFASLAAAVVAFPVSALAIPFPQPQYDDQCQFVRNQIEAAKAGDVVVVPAGKFDCKAPIIIAKDGLTLKGAGKNKTIFRLAAGVHAPLMVIGHPHTIEKGGKLVTPWRTSNVAVKDMTFDGNKAEHDPTKECGETHCDGDTTSIRNNAISIRGSSYILIQDVSSHDSISGGLVTEKYCDNLKVVNFESYNNYFDGFAGYETEHSEFINAHLHNNRGAGISIDIRFDNNTFKGGLLADNGDVGIFARELKGMMFDGIKITNSGKFGVFMASAIMDDTSKCAEYNTFKDVQILNSKMAAIRINDKCEGNVVTGKSIMKGNKGCVDDHGQTRVDKSVICEN